MQAGPRNNHDGCPTIRKARLSSRSQGEIAEPRKGQPQRRRVAVDAPPGSGRSAAERRSKRHRVAQGPSRQSPGPAVRRAEAPPPSPWTKSKRTTVHEEVPSRETNGRIHRRIRSESAAGVKPRPPDAEHCSAPCARCAPDLAGPGMAIWRDAASPPPGEIKSNLI